MSIILQNQMFLFGCCECADWCFVLAEVGEFIQETPAAAASPVSAWEQPGSQSSRPPPGMYHDQNTTEIIQGCIIIQTELIIQTRVKNAWELFLVKCKASGLWDFGLPGRLIRRGLPSAHLKAPSSGNQAVHCCQCCMGSVISWWIYWCLKQKFTPTYH